MCNVSERLIFKQYGTLGLSEFQLHMWCDERIKLCLWSTINHAVIDARLLKKIERIEMGIIYNFCSAKAYNQIKYHVMITLHQPPQIPFLRTPFIGHILSDETFKSLNPPTISCFSKRTRILSSGTRARAPAASDWLALLAIITRIYIHRR